MTYLVPIAVTALLLVIFVSVSLLLLLLFTRDARLRHSSERHTRTDLTNMMILFNTMRDLLSQQKDLARQFNESVDRKVVEIRKLVNAAKAERDELRQAQRQLSLALEDLRDELTALQRQLGYARKAFPSGRRAEDRPPPEPAPDRPMPSPETTPETLPEARLDAVATEPDESDLIDSWSGVDFGGSRSSREPARPAPAAAPERPEDPEEARAAFRSLLNLDSAGTRSSPAAGSTGPGPQPIKGNGRGAAPLHRRVCEYNDAGMSVAEIARELGVGKGEVRLILSLREDKT